MLAVAEGRSAAAEEAAAAAVATFRAHALPWEEAEAHSLRGRTAAATGLYRELGAGSRWLAWADGLPSARHLP
jgi:hypothetical protein